MRKFSSFLYKFSTVIMMIVGIVAAAILAWTNAVQISDKNAWGNPSAAVTQITIFSIAVGALGLIIVFGFLSIFCKQLKFLNKFGKFIIMSLAFVLILGAAIQTGIWLGKPNDSYNGNWTNFATSQAKMMISIFSISVIVLTMNVVFGILAGVLKKAEKKQAQAQA